jgi:hypothetical protein
MKLPAPAATATAPTSISSTATAATAWTPTTIPATTTPSSPAFDFGACFVYIERPSADLGAIESCDGFVSLFCVGHFDKAETARASGVAIIHNTYAVHLSVSFEELSQFFFRSIEVQVPHKDILQASASK